MSIGSSSEQRGIACGQRGWKRHPDGGLSGLGTSPGRMISSRRSSGWLGDDVDRPAEDLVEALAEGFEPSEIGKTLVCGGRAEADDYVHV